MTDSAEMNGYDSDEGYPVSGVDGNAYHGGGKEGNYNTCRHA